MTDKKRKPVRSSTNSDIHPYLKPGFWQDEKIRATMVAPCIDPNCKLCRP